MINNGDIIHIKYIFQIGSDIVVVGNSFDITPLNCTFLNRTINFYPKAITWEDSSKQYITDKFKCYNIYLILRKFAVYISCNSVKAISVLPNMIERN